MKLITKRPLRTQLLYIYTSIFTVMLAIIIFACYYFMDDVYILYNQTTVERQVNQFQLDGPIDDATAISLKQLTGSDIMMANADNEIIYSERPLEGRGQPDTLDVQYLRSYVKDRTHVFHALYANKDMIEEQLFFMKEMEDGSLLILVRNIGLVNEIRQIFLTFLLFITAIVYLVAFISVYFIAGRMVKPIIRLKNAAEQIAALDFDTELPEKRHDEIGDLMVSINSMSGSLSSNIEALNDTNDRLEKELSIEKNLDSMRRRFIADVSHELKNPISMIIAYSEGLVKKIPKTEAAKENYYEVINEEGQRMSQLVTDLLDLSSYQSGTFSMHIEAVDLTSLVKDTLDRFQGQQNEKAIEIEISTAEAMYVKGDRLRLDQVLTNLLSNAFKNVDPGGRVCINFSRQPKQIALTICNTGPLIPDDELKNIWNSFYQLDTDKEGSGLGLAITKSIIDIHKGDIRAYTSQNMNCFEVILKTPDSDS